jgi:hypothetical protein
MFVIGLQEHPELFCCQERFLSLYIVDLLESSQASWLAFEGGNTELCATVTVPTWRATQEEFLELK